jgi:hypothetical protein
VANWPSSLPPLPLAADYADTLPDTLARTQMDAGPAKVRRRTTAAVRPLTASFLFTKAQCATLQTFYEDTLAGGALAFDWILPRTGAAASLRFLAPPTFGSPSGKWWRVTCQLEVLP